MFNEETMVVNQVNVIPLSILNCLANHIMDNITYYFTDVYNIINLNQFHILNW